MSVIEIKHRWTGEVLWSGEAANMRAAVGAAIADRANLTRANLTEARTDSVKGDLGAVLAKAKHEVPGLLALLRAGKVDGSTYAGECSCLLGSIAAIQHVGYESIPGLKPDTDRPAERWFLAIRPGDTPQNSAVAKVTEDWILEFCELAGIAISETSSDAKETPDAPADNVNEALAEPLGLDTEEK